ncbi:terminase small subunit [Deinococcus marmoris]|uniref:terminase small subunit n=1 Tax=Deinococcus marmoris TaxID=249408 RepID=UPI0004981B73|nr:terminase small subunit [Deinococcus marmoris]
MPDKQTRKKPAQKRGKKARKLAAPKGGERPVTEMQKRFCEHLAQGHSQTEALRLAGSKAKAPEVTASRWLRLAKVTAYLQSLPQHQQQETERQDRIATAQERQQILTTILRGQDQANFVTGIGLIAGKPTHTDKLRAADMLAKMNGEYTLNINMKVTQYAKDWLEDLFTILEEFVSPETVDAIAARIRTFNP